MKTFVIYRYDFTDIITLGLMYCEGVYIADTLELPWKENISGISCIPEGTYSLGRYISPHNGECVSVKGVSGRSEIEIHAGNDIEDTKGCILPGVKLSTTVVMSKVKLRKILSELGNKEGTLIIKKL